MNAISFKFRSLISTWFCLFFFALLLLYVIFIEFFQNNQSKQSVQSLVSNPIRSDIIKSTNAIRFKNRIGSFVLKSENNSWVLQEPRVIPAKVQTVSKIMNSLKEISVHTIHQLEPINIQSFSLDKPTIEIDLLTKLDEKVSVKVGIINPINNTSYITVSGQDRIFQINLFKNNFESLELSDFIDSKVFSMSVDQVKSFKLYHNKNKEPFNALTFQNDNWSSKKYNKISTDATTKKLNSILNIKTHMIIDKMDEKLQTFTQNYFDSPLYRLEVETKSGEKIQYTITSAIKAISDLKLEKRQYFLMKASNRPYPYVVNRTFLNDFNIRYSHLR